MGRYSPTVLPDDEPSPFAQALFNEFQLAPQRKREREAEEERAYARSRRPYEAAEQNARLFDQGFEVPGVTRRTERAPTPVPEQVPIQSALAGAIDDQRPDLSGQQPRAAVAERPKAVGMLAPGAFNPALGGFNPPAVARALAPQPEADEVLDFGGGITRRRSLTPEGRAETKIRQQIERAVASGVPRAHAELEAYGGFEKDLHPGEYKPTTPGEEDKLARRDHLFRMAEIEAGAGIRGAASAARDELLRIEKQISDTRAELAAAERDKPSVKDIAAYALKVKPGTKQNPLDLYNQDVATSDSLINELRAKQDSLNGVRDRLVGARFPGIQGGGAQPAAGGGAGGARTPADWVAEVRREHPTWTPEQLANEARRRAGAR